MNDVILNKIASIERCIAQVRKYYAEERSVDFEDDFLLQDAIAMNLQRACEQAIDLANYTIKSMKLGLPQSSKESFRLLAEGRVIERELAEKMEKMVGFKNTLVREYQNVDLDLMIDVIENHLGDLITFGRAVGAHF